MVKKNKNKLRIADFQKGFSPSELTRPHPTLDGIAERKKRKIDRFAQKYMEFLGGVKIGPDVVNAVLQIAEQKDFYSGDNFHFINEDRTAFALVKYGKMPVRKGIKLMYAHCDSPCLKTKPNPLILEWSPDYQPLHTGVELDTFGYGGVNSYQWTGRQLELRGWAVIDGRRKDISFLVYSPETCVHTDMRAEEGIDFSEAHLEEDLDLITGYRSIKDLLNELGFKEKDNFGRARLFAVPVSKPTKIGPYFISAFGHDARVGIFASLKAFFESDDLKYTTMLFGFDNEEVGSMGSGGAQSKFFERVFNETLLKRGEAKRLEDITEALKLDIFSKSLAINTDVDVGATSRDADEERIDLGNVAKLGYGPFLNCIDGVSDGDQISPALIDKIVNYFKNTSVIFQQTGLALVPDKGLHLASINSFFAKRGFPTANISVPVGSLHSPEEIVHIGDLFHAFEAYKRILGVPRKKRKK